MADALYLIFYPCAYVALVARARERRGRTSRGLWIDGMVAALVAAAGSLIAQSPPRAAADELLSADRSFAAAAAGKDIVSALEPMFADDVIVPTPPGKFANGKAEAVAARFHGTPGPGGELVWETTPGNPFALFGGLAG